jgi:steroid delta-isomerase-like uncharacterized protein
MDPTGNKALIRRYLETALAAVRGGDLSATDDYLAEDAVFYDPGRPPSTGREAQRVRSAALVQAFPDVAFEVLDLVAEEDKVATRWVMRGTHRGSFAGVAATDKPISMTGITIYRVVDGKIAEAHSDIDQLGLLSQVGAIPGAAG